MSLGNPLRAATVAATVATALVVAAPAAFAAPDKRRPNPVPKPKPAAVKTQNFTAQGLVVAATKTSLRVITRQLKVGSASLPANTVVTVQRPAGKNKASDLVGYAVTLAGKAAGSGRSLTLTAGKETVKARPAEVFFGTVTAAGPGSLELTAAGAAGGDDDFGDSERVLTVDTSAATSTVDGTGGTTAVGEFAVVLGERDHDTVVAATVDAWTADPDVVAGEITDVSGTTVTLGDSAGPMSVARHGDPQPATNRPTTSPPADDPQPADDQPGDDQPGDDQPGDDQPGDDAGTTVDLAPGGVAVPVVLNGTSTVDPSTLTAGEHLLVLGSTTGDAFTPEIAFVFNGDDHHPARRHHR